MNTNQKGALAESKTISDLISKGLFVYIGFGDSPVDLIAIDTDGELYKIQVKYCSLKNGYIDVNNYIITTKHGKLMSRKYKHKDFDVIAAYIPELDECIYVISDKICNMGSLRIRVLKPLNKQNKRINHKSDFVKFPKRM